MHIETLAVCLYYARVFPGRESDFKAKAILERLNNQGHNAFVRVRRVVVAISRIIIF